MSLIARLEAIEALLSSIEKLLSAEFNADQESSDIQEIFKNVDESRKEFLETLIKPDPILEPEWRPMSEAPRDGTDIMCKILNGEELNAWFSNKHGYWHVSRLGICQEDALIGWRPL